MKPFKISIFLLILCMPGMNTYPQKAALLRDTLISGSHPVNAAVKDEGYLFASEELLEMTLSFSFREFLKTRKNPEYLNANLTIKINDSNAVSQKIKIKARGVVRRDISNFPPIMLKFKNGNHKTGPILANGSLKLVTPCNQTKIYENYVLKEYLAYKLFNLVTPYSFNTRLVKIRYVDSDNPKKTFTVYGFIMENEKDMAKRNEAVLVDSIMPSQKQMNSLDMARVAVFNYMIGNTDWGLPNQHNVRILSSLKEPTGKGIPVAYDFDYSGFVHAEYSVPTVGLPIKDVTERYYSGRCYSDEEIKPVIDEFVELKDQFLSTIDKFDLLPTGEKKRAEMYINSFYKANKTHYALISALNRTCKLVK
jgi:hypothetical protein